MDIRRPLSAPIESLLAGLQPAERMLAFARSRLRPLRDYDRRHQSDLIHTLDAYYACGGSLAAAAERLQTHRNTVLYRLRRIESLTQARLRDPQVALEFQVALRIGAALNQ